MTTYLYYGSAGGPEQARALARRHPGVYWKTEFRDLVVVDPIGLIRLVQGLGARGDDAEGSITVYRRDADPLVLYPLHTLP